MMTLDCSGWSVMKKFRWILKNSDEIFCEWQGKLLTVCELWDLVISELLVELGICCQKVLVDDSPLSGRTGCMGGGYWLICWADQVLTMPYMVLLTRVGAHKEHSEAMLSSIELGVLHHRSFYWVAHAPFVQNQDVGFWQKASIDQRPTQQDSAMCMSWCVDTAKWSVHSELCLQKACYWLSLTYTTL